MFANTKQPFSISLLFCLCTVRMGGLKCTAVRVFFAVLLLGTCWSMQHLPFDMFKFDLCRNWVVEMQMMIQLQNEPEHSTYKRWYPKAENLSWVPTEEINIERSGEPEGYAPLMQDELEVAHRLSTQNYNSNLPDLYLQHPTKSCWCLSYFYRLSEDEERKLPPMIPGKLQRNS